MIRRWAAGSLAVGSAIGLIHLLNGATYPWWAPYLPLIERDLGVSTGVLGLALLGQGVGLIAGGVIAGRVVGRIGARKALIIGVFGYWGTLPLVALTGSVQALFGAVVLVGAGNGFLDVGWGVQSTTFEAGKRRRHHVGIQMTSSAGALLGAVGGSFSVGSAVPLDVHLLAFCVVALILAGGATLIVLPEIHRPRPAGEILPPVTDAVVAVGMQPGRAPRGLLPAMCAICVLGGLLLGGGILWSTKYLQVLGAVPGITGAGLGLIAFTGAGVLGQLLGWLVSGKVAPWVLTTSAALVACAGSVIIVGASRPEQATVGFGLLGVGVALTWPVAQSVAAEGYEKGEKGKAVSWVVLSMYSGLFAAPLIGTLADFTGLRAALVANTVALLAITALALIFMRRHS